MAHKTLSRRQMLQLMGSATATGALAACAPAVTPTAEVAQPATMATSTPAAAAAACQMDWHPTLPPVPKKYDPPVELLTPFESGRADFKAGDSNTNNPLYNRLADNMGVKYAPKWETDSNTSNQRMQAAIASNDLPDIFNASGDVLADMIENQAIEDITDIWTATATDLVKEKKGYPKHPWWGPVTRDGRIFGVPQIAGPGYNIDNVGLIRKDWLDKLGLKIPETLDELDATMRAFVENKLAVYGINAQSDLISWSRSLDPVFGAFGAMPTCWVKADDGTLQYGSIAPGVKDALAVIARWYGDGLIDPDYYTYGYAESGAVLLAGKVGVTFTPWWDIRQSILQTEAKNPGANFVLMEAPRGPGGKRGRKASPIIGSNVVFKKGLDPIKIEAALNQLNWNMEIHVNFDKYQQYGELWDLVEMVFEQGYGWDWDDQCELTVGPKATTTWYTQLWGGSFWFQNLCYDKYLFDVASKMEPWFDQDPNTLNKAQRFIVKDPAVKRSWVMYKFSVDRLDQQIADEYLGVPTSEYNKLMPELSKIEKEYFTATVLGKQPISDFDQFVSDWKSNGGDQVTAAVNAWYKSAQ